MADEADVGNDVAAQILADRIANAAKDIQPGTPGECRMCEEYSPRLVGGVCAPCRDLYKLP